ncbi:MAG: C25 family cysteine peptidase [Thermoplasmata archaeon]
MTEIPAGGAAANDKRKKKSFIYTVFAVIVVLILIAAAVVFWPERKAEGPLYSPTDDLPANFVIVVDAPHSEEECAFIAALSSIAVKSSSNTTINPILMLEDGQLGIHDIWLLKNSNMSSWPILYFTNNGSGEAKIKEQTGQDVFVLPAGGSTLGRFRGFKDVLPVASYREALWAAPVAAAENKVIIVGERTTFRNQKEAWDRLLPYVGEKKYVTVANWEDVLEKPSNFTRDDTKYHISHLSLVAAEIAAFRKGFVLTDWEPVYEEIGQFDVDLNARAIGLLYALKEFNRTYGPVEYICLVGAASSIPQFLLPDTTAKDPASIEGDELVSCDVMYGFLDDDNYTMEAAVGRIVNYNVQGAFQQIARTFNYWLVNEEITVNYARGPEKIRWRNFASVWNGFEVADQRLQMTPGLFALDDFEDEGFVADYMRTTGNGGWLSMVHKREMEFGPTMCASGIVVYRGHGSWHATFYCYEPENTEITKTRLEGYKYVEAKERVHDYLLPPQVAVLVACENAKIYGRSFGEGAPEVDIPNAFAPNYFYGGAVGLIAATEVSFSKIGQDFSALAEKYLPGIIHSEWNDGSNNWDLNNYWFARGIDGLINHEDFGGIGKVVMMGENMYLRFYEAERGTISGYPPRLSPFYQDTSNPYWYDGTTIYHGFIPENVANAAVYWKEIAMFACYGEPAFTPFGGKTGANSYDPWENNPSKGY